MKKKSLIIVVAVIAMLQSGHLLKGTLYSSELPCTSVHILNASHYDKSETRRTLQLAQYRMEIPRMEIPSNANRQFYAIHYYNKCDRTIWTAVHYLDFDGTWVTKGWWKLEPGETAYVAQTNNSIFYVHAYSDDPPNRRLYWTGDDAHKHVRGSDNTYGFRKCKINQGFCAYTYHFTCKED